MTGKEGRAIKLSPRFYGPFKILECINDVSFRLALPANWNMHNAFHSSLLKPFMGQPPAEPIIEDPPQVDELEEVLKPEQIISHQDRALKHGKTTRRFLVKFKNYPTLDAKWMDAQELDSYPHLLSPYLEAFQLRTTE